MQRRVVWIGGAVAVVAAVVLLSLGRQQAGKVADQDIAQALATLPPGYTATHGATDVNPLTGAATLHDVSLSYLGSKLWQAETVTIVGANEAWLHQVVDPAAYPGGRPIGGKSQDLIADFSATGLRVPNPQNPDVTIDIRSVSLHHLACRQFFEAPGGPAVRSRQFGADVALACGVQSLDLHDAAIHDAKSNNAFTLGGLVVRDYAAGKLARLRFDGIGIDANDAKPAPRHIHIVLRSAELKNIDLSAALLTLRDNKLFTPAASPYGSGGEAHLAGFGFDMLPGPSVSLASLDASSVPADGAGLRSGKAVFSGLTISLKDAPLGAAGDALVQAFGMNAVTMDITAVSATDVPANHTKIEEDVDLHDLGLLHLKASFGLANPASAQKDPKAALMQATIDHGSLEWVDKGLVNRAFAAAAAQMHVSADMVRAQLAIPLVSLGFFLPDQPDAVDQVTRFLNNPGTISVTLNPPAPFTLAAVGALPADQRAHAMGVRVEAK